MHASRFENALRLPGQVRQLERGRSRVLVTSIHGVHRIGAGPLVKPAAALVQPEDLGRLDIVFLLRPFPNHRRADVTDADVAIRGAEWS